MNTKTGLVALGLFAFASVNIVNCGGSSDDSGDTGTSGKGGSKSTAGASTTAGTGSGTTAGTSSGGTGSGTAGSAATTAGTSSTGGNTGTAGNATTGGRPSNNGGDGNNNAGGDGNTAPGCPVTQPTDGAMCMQTQGQQNGCDYGDVTCRCRRANGGGNMRTWQCDDAMGNGGAPGGFGQATCPANAQDGDTCTGTGLCTGQQCFCAQGMTNCF